MSSVEITREHFSSELMAEVLPLAQACWDESTKIKAETCAFDGDRGFQVEPDVDAYLKLSNQGSMIVITVRSEGRLVGFTNAILYHSYHHRRVLCAHGDIFYLEPAFRGYAMRLADKLEEEFIAAGVVVVGWATTPKGPVYELLKARHYRPDDTIMEKRLCALP